MSKTLVFDYDGTIHETMKVYEDAVRACLSTLTDNGLEVDCNISSARIAGFLGMNARDMWLDFAPNLTENQREYASKLVGDRMEEIVMAGKASWYKGATAVLDRLKAEGYRMVILSNSKTRTAVYHFNAFGMGKWFDKWYDCESYNWVPKTEIIKDIASLYGNELIMIGDRESDIAAAKEIGITSVGCLYGYGSKEELKDATYQIDDISELINIIAGT